MTIANSKPSPAVTRLLTLNGSMLIISLLFWGYTHTAESQDSRPVKVSSVKRMDVPATMPLLGTVYSRSVVTLTAGVNARLEWIAEPGQSVLRGDVIARMETLPNELTLAEREAMAKRAGINAQRLKFEWDRYQSLSGKDSASKFEFNQAKSSYELALVEQEIANIKRQQTEDVIQRSHIKAPFPGVITERYNRAGSDLQRSDPLIRMLDPNSLEVRVSVPAKYQSLLRFGDVLSIESPTGTTVGQVSAKIPKVTPTSQTIEVRVAIPSLEQPLWMSGEIVNVSIPIEDSANSLVVHRDALLLRSGQIFVVKVTQENIAKTVSVKVGVGSKEYVAIEGDVKADDAVIIRGAEQVSDGQSVVIHP